MQVEDVEGGEFVVRAEIPGLDPDKDIDVQVGASTLRIRAERRQETKTTEKDGSEFRYGSSRGAIRCHGCQDEITVDAGHVESGIWHAQPRLSRREH